MTENERLSDFNMKSTCRACLQTAENLYPLTTVEIKAYQKLTEKASSEDTNMIFCLICRWMLKKCIRFSRQCLRANEILKMSETMEWDSQYTRLLPKNSIVDLKTSNMEVHYLGPMDMDDLNGEEKEELMPLDDGAGDEDDDEIPLVMLQDAYRSKRREDVCEPKMEIEIKAEPVIKEELIEEVDTKVRKKKKKRELKEGFSSRMVQETHEYVVIKLTKDQVLEELKDKAKSESYMRFPYKCEKCVKGFNYEEVLATHMTRHTREHGTYQCDLCTQYCPSPVSLRGHIKSHTTRYKCKLCGQVRLSRQHLLEHHSLTHTQAATTYTCDKCQFTTNRRTTIQRHVKTHAVTANHSCYKCGKLFNTVASLRVHTARHDASRQSHVKAVPDKKRKDYYCVECDVTFKSSESLRLHFKRAMKHRDSSSYKFQCPECPERFMTSSTMLVHLSDIHGAPKQHKCATCHRHYSNRDALRAHTWRVHHGYSGKS